MVHYEPVQFTINVAGLEEVIIDIVICYYGVFELIIIDKSLLFILKFWSLLCYFLKIKKATYGFPSPNRQLDRETKQHNENVTQNIC